MAKRFRNREEAGRQLAGRLLSFHLPSDSLVLGIPRGGVVVAYQVAAILNLPLDVFIARKLGTPLDEELAMGAIASGNAVILNPDVIHAAGVTRQQIEEVLEREKQELFRREKLYRGDRPPIDVKGRTVVVVDDGLATGASMRVAVIALRSKTPASLIVAVPVASLEICAEFQHVVDKTLCLETPEPLHSIGLWYENFNQTSDDEVRALLAKAPKNRAREPFHTGKA